MAIGFNIQFRVNEKTLSRVIRLTDTSTGFTLTKGNFSIVFPDGTTINHTDFQTPDITTSGAYYEFQASTDIYNNVLTGAYLITFVALDNASNSYTITRSFDFNWVKPSIIIQNKSDVFIPEVQFYDATSYSPLGNFVGTLTRVFSVPFPTTCEASGIAATSTSTNTLTPVYAGKYYEGIYNVSLDATVNYTNDTYSFLSLYYTELKTKQYDVRQVPNQTQLVTKMNAFRADVDVFKENNDTQFEIMSENYDIAVALYSHLIARYETNTLDGSQPLLEELLSILEPYNGIYSYKTTQLTPFTLGINQAAYFTLSDGTHTDNFPLQSTLLFSSGNQAITVLVSDNNVTYTPLFGSTSNTFAAGDDARFHNPVTLGTANGLSLASQALSLSLATSGTSGAMSASDKAKLDGIASGATANIGTVTSVGISVPSAFSVTNSPITSSGTITIGATGTALQYIKGDGSLGTLNTAAVAESTNLYYTDSRARASLSLTTTGTSGAATYNPTTGVINIPQYQGGVTSFNTRTGAIVLSTSDITTALAYTPENAANKGIAGGYASLDAGGLIPSTQLPSYVDDVLEYANLASFPISGTTGKIYVAVDTNKIYRWTGSVYIEVSPTVGTIWGGITGTLSNQTDLQSALNAKENTITAGTTAQYWRGDKSWQTLDKTAVGLSNVDNTSDANKPISTAVSTALSGKEPTITAGTTSQYWRGDKTWQDFTTSARAAFSAGTGITITNGVISATLTGAVTSVGLSMPSAFTVTNSPITSTGTLTVTGAGSTAQYINGAGQLVTFPTLLSSDKMLISVRNATGSTLYKGTVVYLSGSTGALPNVVKAQANSEATSAGTFGIIYADLPNNTDGQVVSIGAIDTLDTRTGANGATNPFTNDVLADGDTIYLSPTTAGYITNVKPSAPNHLVYLGKVTRTSPTNGTIVYRVQNGYELDEIHDVQVGSYVNKDVLYRDTATNLWKNGSIVSLLGYTPVPTTRTITINGTAYDLSADRSWDIAGGGGGSITRTVQTFTATANQTTFTITNGYAVGYIDVFVNGVKLTGIDYTASNGTTIVLGQGLIAGDIVDAIIYGSSVLSGTAPIVYNSSTGNVSITQATTSSNGYLSSTDWNTFNNKLSSLTLTTTGSSGASTYSAGTLNIPTYTLSGLGGQALSTNLTSLSGLTYASASFVKMTAAGTFSLDTNTYYLASNPSGYTNNTGTVTSVAGAGTAYGLTLTGTVTTSGSITLGGTLAVPVANITATGTASASTYLRGDGSWATVSGGSSTYTVTSQTANYTVTATSGTTIVKGDTTGGTFTIALPTAVGNTATLIIKKTAGSAGLVIDGAGIETIDGSLTATLNKINESVTLISDNANWQIV